MAFHPSFPSIEVTSTPTPGKFYQPKSGDSIVLISNRAYGSGGGMLGAHVISDSAYNRRTYTTYAMGGSYGCKSSQLVNPQKANALVAFCKAPYPPIWIPQLASKAEPESYVAATDPKTGTTTIPSGSTGSGTGVSTGTAKKTPWKVIGFTILGVVAIGFIMLRRSGKSSRAHARGLRGLGERTVIFIQGNRAQYTGKSEMLYGERFYEVKMLEGPERGKTKIIPRDPSKESDMSRRGKHLR